MLTAMLTFAGLCFNSCSDDDDNPVGGGGSASGIVSATATVGDSQTSFLYGGWMKSGNTYWMESGNTYNLQFNTMPLNTIYGMTTGSKWSELTLTFTSSEELAAGEIPYGQLSCFINFAKNVSGVPIVGQPGEGELVSEELYIGYVTANVTKTASGLYHVSIPSQVVGFYGQGESTSQAAFSFEFEGRLLDISALAGL